MKKVLLISIIMSVLFCGCTTKEDRVKTQSIITQINTVGTVTLEKANDIYIIQTQYNELTDKQKKLVKNYDKFSDIKKQLEELVLEEEIKNDPTNYITESELIGIWKEKGGTEIHKGYFYFSKEGYVYYMGSKTFPNQSDFTGEYILSTQYSLEQYNIDKRAKEGKFYCILTKNDCSFFITKSNDGEIQLEVIDNISGGIYYKTGEKVDFVPEKCLHDDCSELAVETGDSRYCIYHSNTCMICNSYIDEDATFCLNCVVEALKSN